MREICLLFQKGIKHKKETLFGIFLLMFLLAITLTCAVSLRVHYEQRLQQAVKQDGYGDAVFWVLDNTLKSNQLEKNDLSQLVLKSKDVKSVRKMPYIGVNIGFVNGKEENNSAVLQQIDGGLYQYTFFDKAQKDTTRKKLKLKENEVAVPLSFVSSYNCKIGDKITIGDKKEYPILTIKAFFEDPYMGTSLMGIKTLLIEKNTYASLEHIAAKNQDEKIAAGTIFDISKNKNIANSLTDFAFVRNINKASQISSYSSFSLTRSESANYMLMLTNIFSGILIAFLVLILIMTCIIIHHSIETGIELEYKEIGILKALGVSNRQISTYLLLEYVVSVILGELLGTIAAIPVIYWLIKLTQTTINLAVTKQIAYSICILFEGMILVLIICFTLFSLRKANQIQPLQAIREGKDSVYFKSRFELPLTKKARSLSLAYRQFIFSKRNYIGVIFIVAILFFFLIMVNGMAKWGASGEKNIITLFSCFQSDISINYIDSSIQKDVEKNIDQIAGIQTSFYGKNTYMMVEGLQMYVVSISDVNQYNTVYKGRTCKYENEILITQYVSDQLHKKIGDTIYVSYGKKKSKYIVSGIYQCANDVGANVAMSLKGIDRLKNENITTQVVPQNQKYSYEYQLKNMDKKKLLVSYLNKKYDKTQLKVETNDTIGGIDFITFAIAAITYLIYIIALIFSIVTVALVSGKIVRREMKDYAIYKAIGYTSKDIRLQLALRMGINTLLGGILGICFVQSFGKILVSKLFELMGVYHYHVKESIATTSLTFIGIILLFMWMSFVFTGKVKRISVKQLMNEP